MKENGDRESFEAEYAKYQGLSEKAYPLWFERHRDGYTSSSVHASWWGFQAGAAWQRTQSAGVPDDAMVAVASAAYEREVLAGATHEQAWHVALSEAIAAAPAQPAAQELCNCPAGSKPEPHKHAPNCPYRTGAAAQDQGEVQRLREALGDARELIGHGDFSTGVCMCGSGVDGHTIGDGHAPTDEGDYYAGQVMERIDAALAASTGQEVKP